MSSVPERIWISEHNSDGYDTERTGTFRNEYIRADIHESIFSTCESMLTEARAEIERLRDTLEQIEVDLCCGTHAAAALAAKRCRAELDKTGEPPRGAVDELASLVGRLAHALRKAAPDSDLPSKAVDYLKRTGLLGSLLRDAIDAETAPCQNTK